jgi:hypothetical protein
MMMRTSTVDSISRPNYKVVAKIVHRFQWTIGKLSGRCHIGDLNGFTEWLTCWMTSSISGPFQRNFWQCDETLDEKLASQEIRSVGLSVGQKERQDGWKPVAKHQKAGSAVCNCSALCRLGGQRVVHNRPKASMVSHIHNGQLRYSSAPKVGLWTRK